MTYSSRQHFGYFMLMLTTLVPRSFLATQNHLVEVTNQCSLEIWIGIQGNPGKSQPDEGGFIIHPQQTVAVNFPSEWAGRVWGRTGCHCESEHCETGDCGNKLHCNGAGGTPPATLMEITFDGFGGQDYYDISLVDGFNVQASMTPIPGTYEPGTGGDKYYCGTASCSKDVNALCPAQEMKVYGKAGSVIACKSACLAFDTDRYCCRGNYSTPETCPPFPYSELFKSACPDAYSYAYDDQKSTFNCKSKPGEVTGYTVTFKCQDD